MTLLLVLVGGFVGAPVRYLLDGLVQSRHDTAFPWGTFTVNVAGSVLLGLVAGVVSAHGAPSSVLALVGTGFCGALTTFSTFSFETVRLLETGRLGAAAANVGASLVTGVVACAAAFALATS